MKPPVMTSQDVEIKFPMPCLSCSRFQRTKGVYADAVNDNINPSVSLFSFPCLAKNPFSQY
jgi:hypothetical protein